MFTKKQMPDESVDSYANRMRKLANRIDASDETLRYAFVSGFCPKIASFVLSRNGPPFNSQWRNNFSGQQYAPQYPPPQSTMYKMWRWTAGQHFDVSSQQ